MMIDWFGLMMIVLVGLLLSLGVFQIFQIIERFF